MTELDLENLLSLDKAFLETHQDSNLLAEGELLLRWERIPLGHASEAIDWLKSNRQSVTDLEGSLKAFTGLWRGVSIRVIDQTTKGGDKSAHITYLFRRGFATTVNWDEARLLVDRQLKDGGTGPGLDDSSSDNPERFLTIRLPNLNPFKTKAIQDSLIAVDFSSGLPEQIESNDFTSGEWHFIMSSSGRQDEPDGSAFVDVLLARPQYSLKAFDDIDTTRERDRYYLWGVPKDKAQGIIDAWRTSGDDPEGNSASANYSSERGLVDIVLTSNSASKTNLDTDALSLTCDTTVTYSFAFGYNETDIVAWANGYASLTAGTSQQIEINDRGDGKFDGQRRLFTYTHQDPFSFTLPTGTKIDRYEERGWNFKKSEMETKKAGFDTTVQAVGLTCAFQVTREDDCTFDYIGIKQSVTHDQKTGTLTAPLLGIALDLKSGLNATQSEFDTALGTFSPGARKTHRISVDPNEDETLNYSIFEEESREVQQAETVAGDSILYGSSVDPSVLPDFPDENTVVLKFAQFSGNPDGTVNYLVSTEPLYDITATKSDTVAKNKIHFQMGENQDSYDVELTGERLQSASVRKGDNGKYNYSYLTQDIDETQTTTRTIGEQLRQVEYTIGENVTAEPAPDSLSQGVSADLRTDITDEGRYNFTKTKTATQPDVETFIELNNGILTTQTEAGKYALAVPDASNAGESIIYQATNDDKTYNYLKKIVSLTGTTTWRGRYVSYEDQKLYPTWKDIPRYEINSNDLANPTYKGEFLYFVWLEGKRDITKETTVTVSLSPLNADNSGANVESVVKQEKELFIKETTVTTFTNWQYLFDSKQLIYQTDEDGVPTT